MAKFYMGIHDYQGGDFCVGRIWHNKKELIEQVYEWNDIDGFSRDTFLRKLKVNEIVDYIMDVWEIEIVKITLTQAYHLLSLYESKSDLTDRELDIVEAFIRNF